MKIVSPLQTMVMGHLQTIHGAYSDPGLRKTPRTFFADSSFLEGEMIRILHSDLDLWHSCTAAFSREWRTKRRGHLITRIIPLPKKRDTIDQQRIAKYVLHYQLALGLELAVFFTDELDILDRQVESSNFSLVDGFAAVRSPRFWEPGAPIEVKRTRKKAVISDLHCAVQDMLRSEDAIRLKYNHQTFTANRVQDLKSQFGDFLFALQGGKCAITGDRLDGIDWEVDHVFPRSLGGNNSLVNLQAVKATTNRQMSATVKDDRWSLRRHELVGHLAVDEHRKLSDRGLLGLELGQVRGLNHLLV